MSLPFRIIIPLFSLFFLMGTSVRAENIRTDHSSVELISATTSIRAGQTITIGLDMRPDPGWHTYWINPGDAGLPVEIDWTLPKGFTVSKMNFPTPITLDFGGVISYGYESDTLILMSLTAPEVLPEGRTSITFGGTAFWLICDDRICIPEQAEISLTLPVGDGLTNPVLSDVFANARAKLPLRVSWPARFTLADDQVIFDVMLPDAIAGLAPQIGYVYPTEIGLINHTAAQSISRKEGHLFISVAAGEEAKNKSETDILFALHHDEDPDEVVILRAAKADNLGPAAALTATSDRADLGTDVSISSQTGAIAALLKAIVFAFLGGLILNLMPCVFPILSLKALSVVAMAKKHPAEVRRSGLIYTAGVLTCFALIAGAILSLKLGGYAVGWGFQMQQPIINYVLAMLMVTIGLNLFGLFEFGTGLMGLGQNLTKGDNKRKATFFTGFLAVVVATPCSAPFMAGALGYAFVQPPLPFILVFLMLGFGLAFPYLLLCYVPAFRGFLPKPGAWMDVMRKILGFPMLATALWLFWILGSQLGIDAMAFGLGAALILGFALWSFDRGNRLWNIIAVLSLLLVVYVGSLLHDMGKMPRPAHRETQDVLKTEEFSSAKLADYVNAGQPIFVYFTADWCVTCKVNERIALSKTEVAAAFEKNSIIVMKGDWTNRNDDIRQTLQRYRRIGVPLYLYFPKGSSLSKPVILPQILTPNTIIEVIG